MLLLFATSMLLASFSFLCLSRNKRSVLIFLTTASLFEFIFSILMYISKKGGISKSVSIILYGSYSVRKWMQYMVLSLGELGYLVAIGRYLFPFFLLMTALDMSYFNLALWARRHFYIFFILPFASLVIYHPYIFQLMLSGESVLRLIVALSKCWVYMYIILAFLVIAIEYISITMRFFKRRFITKCLIVFSLGILFSIYAGQDPAQIYLFYRNDYMWMLGLLYLSPVFNPFLYGVVIIGSMASSVVGFTYLIKYIRVTYDDKREEVVLRRKASAATTGISMFTHGTKNELLSSRILLERAAEKYDDDDITRALAINSSLLERLNNLNHMANNGNTTLVPIELKGILEDSIKEMRMHYTDSSCIFSIERDDISVLADSPYLKEAISNLLVNAWESELSSKELDPVLLEVKLERLWVTITIADRGNGISKDEKKRIFEPFYSSKSSSSNWGMGMYFVRSVIKAHLGSIRFESRTNGGTRFIVLLPRLEKNVKVAIE